VNTKSIHLSEKLINVLVLRATFRSVALAAIAFALCLFTTGPAVAADSSVASPDKPAEFMIYQYPGVALLIRIDALETEFVSRVYGSERALIKASHIPMRRIGPVYQFIEAIDTARQLIVEIIPAKTTERSRISMELVQLPQNERNSRMQSDAFRLFSRAVDSTSANDSTTWAMKIYTLEAAASEFERLGWEELRLWSLCYAAHLTFYKMSDELSAIELVRKVQRDARKAGFKTIELATLQLEGAALLQQTRSQSGQAGGKKDTQIHSVLEQASALAEDLGLRSESSLALFNDGIAWEQQDKLGKALVQYRRALEIANQADDDELANEIRNKAAFAYEAQGSVSGAIEMLDQIGVELSSDNAALELAQNLFEKGRILMSRYRYSEAVDVLLEAFSLQENNGAVSQLGRTGLALGQAYYGMGRMDQAGKVLQESLARTSVTGQEQSVRDALGVLAAVYRFQGDYSAMSKTRDAQAAYIRSKLWRARHTFERATDQNISVGGSSTAALALFRQSQQMARSSGDTLLQHRALIQLCSHDVAEKASNQACSANNIQRALEFLLAAGIPRYALEARFAESTMYRKQGRLDDAIDSMGGLVGEIRYFREVLPGVLGGWYWENRDRIFSEYMSQVLRKARVGGKGSVDGIQPVLTFERLSAINTSDNRAVNAHTGQEKDLDSIRSWLAAVDEASSGAGSLSPAPLKENLLDKSRTEFYLSRPDLTIEKLNGLINHLPQGAGFLSYYFSADATHAIYAGKSGIRAISLPRSSEILSSLKRLSQGRATGSGFDQQELKILGDLLLRPLAKWLPELIYFMPAGPLNGVPLDLLLLDGDYLASRHRVINLISIAALDGTLAQVDTGNIDTFFLAGDPEAKRDVFDYEQTMSAEIRTVTDVFVGPALHIVQGSALKRDEFQDERFEKADVIHLAVPGTISLDHPAQSIMVLSGSGLETGSEFLRPGDFQQRQFMASLAVLSAVRVQGFSRSGFNNYLGFVTDLLRSGVGSVVTSLWTLEEQDRAKFMAVFYRNLAQEPDVASALFQTKRQFLSQAGGENTSRWGGFQVYLH
jgi:tetratricopeptide (TPR) repeat protein